MCLSVIWVSKKWSISLSPSFRKCLAYLQLFIFLQDQEVGSGVRAERSEEKVALESA